MSRKRRLPDSGNIAPTNPTFSLLQSSLSQRSIYMRDDLPEIASDIRPGLVTRVSHNYFSHVHLNILYCIVSIYLYSASCSAHQSEALPVRETQREESSLERTKRGTWHTS